MSVHVRYDEIDELFSTHKRIIDKMFKEPFIQSGLLHDFSVESTSDDVELPYFPEMEFDEVRGFFVNLGLEEDFEECFYVHCDMLLDYVYEKLSEDCL